MAKEFFKNLPDTSTPLTAPRLNDLLDGEEPMGNLVVESIRTKNMFDKSTIVQGGVDGTASTSRISTRQELWLEAGTYTFSTNMPSTYRYGILIRPSAPPTSTTSSYDSGWQTSTSFTFTLSTSGYYMMNFAKNDNTNLTPSDINSYNFQLEEGSTTTTYSEYQNLDGEAFIGVIPTSVNLGTLANNSSCKSKNLLNVNFKISGVTLSVGIGTTIITLPSDCSPKSESSLMAITSSYVPLICWLRNNGTIAIASGTALSNVEVRIVGSVYLG